MNIQVNLFQCRLCLKKTATRVNIFGGDFPKMLEILTSIKVQENDGLPKYSCSKCAQEVKSALLVKRRIIKAHKMLSDAVKKKRQNMLNFHVQNTVVIIDDGHQDEKTSMKCNNEDPSGGKTVTYKDLATTGSIRHSVSPEFVSVNQIEKEPTTLQHKMFKRNTIPICMKTKNMTNEYHCEICDVKFPDKHSFTLHMAKHKKTKCKICGRNIRTDNFKKHMMMHSAGPSVCQLCGVTCKNFESLRGHIFYQHKSTAEEYICDECGKSFRTKYKFLLHKKKVHIGLRNFKCETCGKGYFTKGYLTNHIKMTHEKLRPHVCEFCGVGFSSTYALKTHKRQHTDEKPFVCIHCCEGFRQKVSLRSHLKSKHGIEEEKAHFCKSCDKGFATSYALSIHERLHRQEKCEICSESFAGEFLKTHIQQVHNGIQETNTEGDKQIM